MSKNNKLLTAADVFDVLDCPFKNEKERIKYMSKAYKNMSIAKSFSIFYGVELSQETKQNKSINTINNIEVGNVYTGTVKTFTKNEITFDIPGVKEEIVCRENFSTCMENVQQYLLENDNKLLFEVREKQRGSYVVSVINAYYRAWVNIIEKSMVQEDGIKVHIDELVKCGYLCHTNIWTLEKLTGKPYTSSVFIPGSHIVLNIEHDFEKWLGQDVIIVPQKFVEYRKDLKTGLTERSLVGSRKRVLQLEGITHMYNIWEETQTRAKLAEMSNTEVTPVVYDGTVTGIINSNKKTGIFIELDGKYITGLMPMEPEDLLDYRPGDAVKVVITEFEVQEGKEPFVTNKKKHIVKCNVRPVFALA
jgi:ribosomal protein S1